MSLFKVREFWSTYSDNNENFDQNSMITTPLSSDSDYIITGSQSGVLRIFKPCNLAEDNKIQDFTAADLLIEKIFDSPILQVGCGRLVSASRNIQLAVLHPKLLSVYLLKSTEGIAAHGNQNHLERLYEHTLRRSATNFVIGPFGGTQNRDFICVQSLDGMLTFFEQENFSFSCFLSDFLLPTPIAYVRKTDSFVTCDANWRIVAYRYKLLSESGEKTHQQVTSTLKVDTDWSLSLGESIIDIAVIDDIINKENWIMVLGERNLYCLNFNGTLKFMKRLEYSPLCFNTYLLGENIFSMVVSETNTLLIYQNTMVKWSAQLHFLPVSIKRAFLKVLKGALVLLSEDGRLECCYLGTEPSLFVAPPIAREHIDFDKVEEELVELNKKVKQLYGNDMKIDSETEKEITVNISVNPNLEPCVFETDLKDIENHGMCAITIDILPQIIFEEVQVAISVHRPLKVIPDVQFYTDLTEKTSFTCYAYLYEVKEVPSLSVDVITTVISNLGIPKVIQKTDILPMKLALEVSQAQKDAEYKITLNINQSSVPLATLFSEYTGDTFGQSSNAVAFRNISGAGKAVAILLAKSSERYRLQSDSFASLSLLIEAMIFRLQKHCADKSDFKISYSSTLPSNEFLLYVNNHFRKRQQAVKLQGELDQLGSQYRVIQKRLVAKYKQKNPTPLTNLSMLLEDTYTNIIGTKETLEKQEKELCTAQGELSCALTVVNNLISLLNVDKDLKETLESVFCNSVQDVESQSWEDVIDASMCYLLRTSLAKSEKDRLRAENTGFEEIKNISKLEKHLNQVFERINKKAKEAKDEPEQEFTADEENVEQDGLESSVINTKPIGSQFGEASSRLLSARKNILRRRHNTDETVQM